MAGNDNDHTTFKAADAPSPVGAYPHAKKIGDLVFLSGIGPRAPGGGPIPGAETDARGKVVNVDIEAQCRSVFRNVRTVLESAGCRWEDLVDVTVYLTNIERDFDDYNRVYAEFFSADGPCRTTVEVSRLPTPIAIELKCIAKAR